MINFFWWGSNPNGGRRIHWAAWEKLCSRKEKGGLGFCHLHSFNLALLAKQGWRLVMNPSSLCARVLSSKYYIRSNF